MNKPSQEEYNQVIKDIEENSVYKFSAGTDTSGAFLVPVTDSGTPMGDVFYQTWNQLKKLAEIVKNKPGGK